ncbi:MAG: PEP/pyruvate-binding domain-containing protein [Actinomyces sp.]|jgi:hypothetical protein|nr:PEP/pyruvate-binding domain-containing protein [Actinomyces sp.]MCI1642478.1 PEP/pyruvate-binding domain-containing protein [Actinomyces sp.]
MEPSGLASTGISGLDRTIDHLRLGDNVVWQVDSVADFEEVSTPFVRRTLAEGRQVHRLRFRASAPAARDALVAESGAGAPPGDGGENGTATEGTVTHWLDPSEGFEAFTTHVHRLIHRLGATARYVVDPLTALEDAWHSDAMVANFFAVTCPLLFQLDTVAYFCLVRGRHAPRTIATVRDTTQVLFELHRIDGRLYVHPLKVWARYSPTMFFPARLDGDEVRPITSSVEASRLFAAQDGRTGIIDPWAQAVDAGDRGALIAMLVGTDRDDRIAALCRRWMTREDLVAIARRVVGTGRIGGKSVGMLLARAILRRSPASPRLDGDAPAERLADRLEPHDSFFIGSDFFYSYVVANGWWQLRMRQKEPGHFLDAGAELHDRLLTGAFPPAMRDEFWRVLDHFGQSPIIVRSSSLLEDGFGNAFAGKYDSVFLANQGSPEDRERAFEDAVRQVYASSMSPEALAYRRTRGLEFRDEQMAILVQRVSGDRHVVPTGPDGADETLFLPHAAGVANSSNLYTWSPDLDPDAGMLRLVVGLGTRAVNRTGHDYARVAALDAPLSGPSWDGEGGRASARTTQHRLDALLLSRAGSPGPSAGGLRAGAVPPEEAPAPPAVVTRPVSLLQGLGLADAWKLFASPDEEARRRLRELGRDPDMAADLVDFRGLLAPVMGFTGWMRSALAALRTAYDYPVDVEFTLNIDADGSWRVNVVQCRPLQTRGPSSSAGTVSVPEDPGDALVALRGHFMGGSAALPLTHVILVRPEAYAELGARDRHEVARKVGAVARALRESPVPASVLLLGPGRWGTTTPSLGVPAHFAEIAPVAALGELAGGAEGFRPELSWGSHFFQDLVEAGIFYLAIDPEAPGTAFRPGRVLDRPNLLADLVPDAAPLADVLHVAATDGMELRADVVSQRVLCR